MPEELAGQTIECPACNASMAVPVLELLTPVRITRQLKITSQQAIAPQNCTQPPVPLIKSNKIKAIAAVIFLLTAVLGSIYYNYVDTPTPASISILDDTGTALYEETTRAAALEEQRAYLESLWDKENSFDGIQSEPTDKEKMQLDGWKLGKYNKPYLPWPKDYNWKEIGKWMTMGELRSKIHKTNVRLPYQYYNYAKFVTNGIARNATRNKSIKNASLNVEFYVNGIASMYLKLYPNRDTSPISWHRNIDSGSFFNTQYYLVKITSQTGKSIRGKAYLQNDELKVGTITDKSFCRVLHNVFMKGGEFKMEIMQDKGKTFRKQPKHYIFQISGDGYRNVFKQLERPALFDFRAEKLRRNREKTDEIKKAFLD